MAWALLALGGLLGACQRTTELPVTMVTYLGVPLDLVRQEQQPRTSYGDATLFLVIRCAASGRVVLRQSLFPGPEWAVLKTPGRITATREGVAIRGTQPEQTVVIRSAQVTPCTQAVGREPGPVAVHGVPGSRQREGARSVLVLAPPLTD